MFRAGSPVLVLIPGSHQDCRQYAEVASHLDRDLGLIIVELPGHRESRTLPADPSIERFAADVLTVMHACCPQPCYVGGHSLGGMIAIELGQRCPEMIRGIISIEGWTDASVADQALGGQKAMYRTLSPQLLARQEELRDQATGHRAAAERRLLSGLWMRWSGMEFLQTTRLPVLELWGDRGRPRPTLAQMHIPDRPNISLQWFANASHNLPLERPAEVARAITQFIRRTRQ